MIAIQKIGKSFMGALGYNLRKINHADFNRRAQLLDFNFSSLDRNVIKGEVDLLRLLRPNLNRYVYHTSLNFSKEEEQHLDNEKLLAIGHEYLYASGYTNNQYLIFRHFDAGHPHLHLLVNRICFDGSVVSDSNNYKKSEAILRRLEQLYNLVAVELSRPVSQRAPKKDELEKVIRTGRPSDKMMLQQLMNTILKQKNLTLSELISEGEKAGISFLFNQQSTGRISGVTYFYNDFKIKGQALGNRFKWSELLKSINYEQARDSITVSEANCRTRAIYGEEPLVHKQELKEQQSGNDRNDTGLRGDSEPGNGKQKAGAAIDGKHQQVETGLRDAGNDAKMNYVNLNDLGHHSFGYTNFSEIADDVDDEAVYGKKRRRRNGFER